MTYNDRAWAKGHMLLYSLCVNGILIDLNKKNLKPGCSFSFMNRSIRPLLNTSFDTLGTYLKSEIAKYTMKNQMCNNNADLQCANLSSLGMLKAQGLSVYKKQSHMIMQIRHYWNESLVSLLTVLTVFTLWGILFHKTWAAKQKIIFYFEQSCFNAVVLFKGI